MKRFLLFFAKIGIAVILIISMLYFLQEKLIFRSSSLPKDYTYRFENEFEELFLKSDDGAVLNGLHFKRQNPKGVILYCHGNAGELDSWGGWAQELSERYRYDVVIWDYRGYGKSTGKRRQNSMLDDGFLFYGYCKKYFTEQEITVFGRSLGGFFATHISKNKSPGKLILESTPTSLLNIAEKEYPFLPSRLLLKFRFQNNENIKQIKDPTFIIHGTQDALVPYENGEQLYKDSPATPKKLFSIVGGSHNDLKSFEAPYFKALDEILK